MLAGLMLNKEFMHAFCCPTGPGQDNNITALYNGLLSHNLLRKWAEPRMTQPCLMLCERSSFVPILGPRPAMLRNGAKVLASALRMSHAIGPLLFCMRALQILAEEAHTGLI